MKRYGDGNLRRGGIGRRWNAHREGGGRLEGKPTTIHEILYPFSTLDFFFHSLILNPPNSKASYLLWSTPACPSNQTGGVPSK